MPQLPPFLGKSIFRVSFGLKLKVSTLAPFSLTSIFCLNLLIVSSTVKMRKKEVCPSEVYTQERGVAGARKSSGDDSKSKDLLNLVVVGHVDSGKSTLMGHMLCELGNDLEVLVLVCKRPVNFWMMEEGCKTVTVIPS